MPLHGLLIVLIVPVSCFCPTTRTILTTTITTTATSTNLEMVGLKSKYDFARGHPNPSLLPTAEMKEIMLSVVDNATGSGVGNDGDDENDKSTLCLNYGHEQGSPELLRELRSFLDRHTANDDIGGDTKLDESVQNSLFITHGVSQGIDLLCSTQLAPGDVVWVERPTYFLVADIFRSHRLVVRGMPMVHPSSNGGTGGIDVKRLVEMVESGRLSAPKMIYLVPTHQNPTGHTMPVHDRILLAKFAKKYGTLVVADEVYHLLDWRDEDVDGQRPARMAEFNKMDLSDSGSDNDGTTPTGCCISVSSFTKIFAPGIRCGWIEAPERIVQSIARHGYIQSQGGLAPFVGDLIMNRALCDRIADNYLRKLNEEYADRARKICAILQQEERIVLPNGCPTGGYFLWVRFPQGIDSEGFLKFCVDQGTDVRFRPGTLCDAFANHPDGEEQIANDEVSGVTASTFQSYARLCFADLDTRDLEEGCRELVKAFKMYMDE